MAYVFNPFTGNLDVAEQVTFDGDLTSYEKKIDSEARDQNLQDQIDAFDGDALDDAPSDGSTYGRKDGAWEAITAGSGDVEEAPKDGTPYSRQDGTWVSAGDGASMPEPPDDGVVYGRKTESGVSSWEVVPDGGSNPSDGAIDTITVTSPLTKTGPLTDPVLGIDLSAYAEKTDILVYRLETDKTTRSKPQIQLVDSENNFSNVTVEGADGIECTSNAAGILVSATALQARVADLENELAALKDQMAKVLQDGDKIVGGVTTTDSDSGDAVFSGNIEIQL